MGDICKTLTLKDVIVQENGIIRNSLGTYMARLDGLSFVDICREEIKMEGLILEQKKKDKVNRYTCPCCVRY